MLLRYSDTWITGKQESEYVAINLRCLDLIAATGKQKVIQLNVAVFHCNPG